MIGDKQDDGVLQQALLPERSDYQPQLMVDVSTGCIISLAGNEMCIRDSPSATRVNQENRIKLMLSVARERLGGQNGGSGTPQPVYGLSLIHI